MSNHPPGRDNIPGAESTLEPYRMDVDGLERGKKPMVTRQGIFSFSMRPLRL
jgi:hypothetical protein